MDFEELLACKPYELQAEQKKELLTDRLNSLTKHHKAKCREYSDILDSMGNDDSDADSYEKLPFLPVRLFKELSLKSVPDKDIVKKIGRAHV